MNPRAAGVGEAAVEAADQQFGGGFEPVDALGPGPQPVVVLLCGAVVHHRLRPVADTLVGVSGISMSNGIVGG